eukprot:1130740-Amphidinium_carterae.1
MTSKLQQRPLPKRQGCQVGSQLLWRTCRRITRSTSKRGSSSLPSLKQTLWHFQVSSRHFGRRATSCCSWKVVLEGALGNSTRVVGGQRWGRCRSRRRLVEKPRVEFGLMDDDVHDAAEPPQLAQARAKAVPTQAQRLLALRLCHGQASASDLKAAAEL